MQHTEIAQSKEPYLGQLSVRSPNFNERERERERRCSLKTTHIHTGQGHRHTHTHTHNTLICNQLNSVSFNSFISDKLKV